MKGEFLMADRNEQRAPNNQPHSSKKKEAEFHEFSEELSDGGIRDEMIQIQLENVKRGKKANH